MPDQPHDPDELSFPTEWSQPPIRLASEADLPVNLDTGLPLPSPSRDDSELVEQMINRYHNRLDYDNQDRVLEEVLTEAVVRARTRGLRSARESAALAAGAAHAHAVRLLTDATELAAAGNWIGARAQCDLAALQFAAAEAVTRHNVL